MDKELYLSGVSKVQTNQLQYLHHNEEGVAIGFTVAYEGSLKGCIEKLNEDMDSMDGICEHQIVSVIASAIL